MERYNSPISVSFFCMDIEANSEANWTLWLDEIVPEMGSISHGRKRGFCTCLF